MQIIQNEMSMPNDTSYVKGQQVILLYFMQDYLSYSRNQWYEYEKLSHAFYAKQYEKLSHISYANQYEKLSYAFYANQYEKLSHATNANQYEKLSHAFYANQYEKLSQASYSNQTHALIFSYRGQCSTTRQ